jgi:hypothetical protein
MTMADIGLYLRSFEGGGITYSLHHNSTTDARQVTRLADHPPRVLLTIDSSLCITDDKGQRVAHIASSGTGEGSQWVLHWQGRETPLAPYANASWRNLEHAECIAAGLILAGSQR